MPWTRQIQRTEATTPGRHAALFRTFQPPTPVGGDMVPKNPGGDSPIILAELAPRSSFPPLCVTRGPRAAARCAPARVVGRRDRVPRGGGRKVRTCSNAHRLWFLSVEQEGGQRPDGSIPPTAVGGSRPPGRLAPPLLAGSLRSPPLSPPPPHTHAPLPPPASRCSGRHQQ